MKTRKPFISSALAAFLAATALAETDPLPSWSDGAAKQGIVRFVQKTTTKGSPEFVPPAEMVSMVQRAGHREGAVV